jgi:hypothetical protein
LGERLDALERVHHARRRAGIERVQRGVGGALELRRSMRALRSASRLSVVR